MNLLPNGSTGKRFPIWAKCHAQDIRLVPAQRCYVCASIYIPQMEGRREPGFAEQSASTYEQTSIRTERYAGDIVFIPFKRNFMAAGRNIPQTDIPAATGKGLTIRTERDA